jgi:hypothetical protein
VLRQNSQTPWKDADDLKTTGAPQAGQLAENGIRRKPV